MTRLPGLKRLMRIERDAAGIERAVRDELDFHLDMTVKDLMTQGMNPDDARREAQRRFGDVERTRERLTTIDRSRVGRERRAEWWSAFAQDLRYALRGLRLKPGFTIGVVLTLGLGIGANAAMFGIVDRLLFRPPAYLIAPDRTHHIYLSRVVDGKEFVGASSSYQRFRDFARDTKTMEMLAAYSATRRPVGTGDAARELPIGAMTASMWSFFELRPVIGRFFTPDEDRYPDVTRVVVLSYGYWQSQFAGSRDVIGRSLDVGPARYTIIGVAPRGFSAVELMTPSMFIPLAAAAVDGFGARWVKFHNTYNITWLKIYTRRKPGVTIEAATADMTDAYRRSYVAQIAEHPQTPALETAKPHAVVASVLDERGPSPSAEASVAAWLLGVACVVLLIACANVGNLLLARAFRRRREIAVRLALGVSRSRLASQLILESLLLAAFGAAVGITVAQWGGQVLRATLLPQVEWGNALGDTRVLAFTGACALATGLLAGLAPIFQARRYDVASELKAGPREGGGQRSRLRTSLLVLQAALSVVLLVGAGLFVRSVQNVQTLHLGYDADRILWVEAHLRGITLDSAHWVALNESLAERARANAAVENASVVLSVPFAMAHGDDIFVPGIDTAKIRGLGDIILQGGSPSYFATTGTRIVQGRGFSPYDDERASPVVVLSEALASGLWPNDNAIGKCIKVSADTAPCRTVVGVAENSTFRNLGGEAPHLMYYLPVSQFGANLRTVFVRLRGASVATRTEEIRRALQSVMPAAGYLTVQPLTNVLERETRSWRLGATMFAVFGGLALMLAAIGLYSVIAYSVTQRTHEMGVRVALGARIGDVVALIVGDGLRVVVVGVAIGLTIALTAGHWIAPLLFGVSARDPLVFSAVAVALVAVALIASWVPAMRASRVDPATALRAD